MHTLATDVRLHDRTSQPNYPSTSLTADALDWTIRLPRTGDNPDVTMSYYCGFAVSILFLFGSVYFVWLSYPEEMARMEKQIATEDASTLSFSERSVDPTRLVRCLLSA